MLGRRRVLARPHGLAVCHRSLATQRRVPQVPRSQWPEPVLSWEKRLGGSTHRFPDWVEKWGPSAFYRTGTAACVGVAASMLGLGASSVVPWLAAVPVAAFWVAGLNDMKQGRHAVRRNFPVLGRVRYLFESVRPEIRQYFVESDDEAVPFSRQNRSVAYSRAKDMSDTMPFGTRKDVNAVGYEWINHSMWPTVVPKENSRVLIGGPHCSQPYSSSLFNISGMSYGALSANAILALNAGAKAGNFFHNTGEGGVSRYHLEHGADLVYNVGTGYFGCRNKDGTFDASAFRDCSSHENIKMIELKLSQGAKPAHGGLLPKDKITHTIAEARGISMDEDCNSPAQHSAFSGADGLVEFIAQLRELSGGKPIGLKFCVGRFEEVASIMYAMAKHQITPDFITIDGAEGGTGAAPPEFSNSVGTPLVEGLRLVDSLLVGANLRNNVRVIASGKILSGFSLVKHLALGADACNSARAFMFALGCIQALKCNSNTCPTGIATQNEELMKGLVIGEKALRVFRFQQKTLSTALEIVGSVGLENPSDLTPDLILRRTSSSSFSSYSNIFPSCEPGSLLRGEAYPTIQSIWDRGRGHVDAH